MSKVTALAAPEPPPSPLSTWTEADVEAEVLRRLRQAYAVMQGAMLATIAETYGIDPSRAAPQGAVLTLVRP